MGGYSSGLKKEKKLAVWYKLLYPNENTAAVMKHSSLVAGKTYYVRRCKKQHCIHGLPLGGRLLFLK